MIFPGKKDVILFLFCSVQAKEPAESVEKKFFVVEQSLYQTLFADFFFRENGGNAKGMIEELCGKCHGEVYFLLTT